MACCKGIEPRDPDLKKITDDLYLNINKSKLKFFVNEKGGIFKLVNNQEGGVQISSDLNTAVDQLSNEIKKKDARIDDLKQKIKEIDEKINSMNKILAIDISEKEYITDLGEKVKASQMKN